MNKKIIKLREKLHENGIDGMIITNKSNIRYLTRLNAEGILLITDKENIFITDARYIEEAENKLTIEDEIVIYDVAGIRDEEYIAFFEDCDTVGFEENDISYARYAKCKVRYRLRDMVETNNLIKDLRMIKDEDEISNIRKACEITDKCFSHLVNFIKPNISERDIAFEIEKFFLENGADGLAFDTVVASGENSSKPHAVPTGRKIKYNDAITIDMGATYNGYASDMTRTIFIGTVDEELKKMYNLLLACQKRVTAKIKEGASTKEITEGVIKEFDIAGNYSLVHALGHGVGVDVHEIPVMSDKSNYILKQDMIVTNEPGIYIPGKYGMRIEDTILVNKMTSEVLTKSSKELIVI